jgi:hypothetical protein
MKEIYHYRGTTFEIKKVGAVFEVIGGSRRAKCRQEFKSEDSAKNFIRYNVEAPIGRIASR